MRPTTTSPHASDCGGPAVGSPSSTSSLGCSTSPGSLREAPRAFWMSAAATAHMSVHSSREGTERRGWRWTSPSGCCQSSRMLCPYWRTFRPFPSAQMLRSRACTSHAVPRARHRGCSPGDSACPSPRWTVRRGHEQRLESSRTQSPRRSGGWHGLEDAPTIRPTLQHGEWSCAAVVRVRVGSPPRLSPESPGGDGCRCSGRICGQRGGPLRVRGGHSLGRRRPPCSRAGKCGGLSRR